MKKLSICIPTYNFGEFIGQTLDSILPQITLDVEVVILDGGSTDDTAEVVAARQFDYKQLSYYYQDFRGGIDRDIEKVVSLAQGKYCWLFSADDIMLPGAVDKILEEIKFDMDIYICEHILCDLNMQPIREYPPFNNVTPQRIFNMSLTAEKKEYFYSARTSEAFFSFLAGPIFKKEIWDKVNIPQTFRGTCWIVAGRLLSVISEGVSIKYLGVVLLNKRGENDSFSNQGIVNRYKISIINFQHVADVIFGRSSRESFHIRRVLRSDVSISALLRAKLRAREEPVKENIMLLQQIVDIHYSDATIGNLVRRVIFKVLDTSYQKAAAVKKV
jgi:abequosyltransferase